MICYIKRFRLLENRLYVLKSFDLSFSVKKHLSLIWNLFPIYSAFVKLPKYIFKSLNKLMKLKTYQIV